MSLVELKERLRLNKIRTQEHVEEKRETIITHKVEKETVLKSRFDNLHKIREAKSVERLEKRAKRIAHEEAEKLANQRKVEDQNMELAKRLEARAKAIKQENDRIKAGMMAILSIVKSSSNVLYICFSSVSMFNVSSIFTIP